MAKNAFMNRFRCFFFLGFACTLLKTIKTNTFFTRKVTSDAHFLSDKFTYVIQKKLFTKNRS